MDPETDGRSTEELIDAAATRIAAAVAAAADTPAATAEQIAVQLQPQLVTSLQEILVPVEADREALVSRLETVEGELASRPEAGEIVSSAQRSAAYNPLALGVSEDGTWESSAEFYRAAIRNGRQDLGYRPDQRLNTEAVLSGQEIDAGGALVPEEFRANLMTTMLEAAVVRPGARVVPMGTETMRYPYVRDYDHSSGRVYGGWQVYRLERGEQIPRTRPSWGQQRLTVTTQAAATVIDNALLADAAIGLQSFIDEGLPAAVAWAEDYEFIRGDGAGEPMGILNSDAVVMAGVAGRQATADQYLVARDISAMSARLLPACRARAVYLAHPGLEEAISNMTLSGAQYARRGQTEAVPLNINGRPVLLTEHCSAPGTSGDIILIDRMMYVIGDRQATTLASSMHLLFDQLQTIVIAHSRNDGQLIVERPLTLRHGGSAWTQSCAVVLPDAAGSVEVGAADPNLLGGGYTRGELEKLRKADLIDLITGGDGGGDDTSSGGDAALASLDQGGQS